MITVLRQKQISSASLLLLLTTVISLLFSQCRYQLGLPKNPTLQGINTIQVALFKNKTFFPQINAKLQRSLVHRISTNTRLRVAAIGDAKLRGEIISIKRRQILSSSIDILFPDRIVTTLQVRWQLVKNGKTLFNRITKADNDFFVEKNIQLSENNSLFLLVDKMATQIAQQLIIGY